MSILGHHFPHRASVIRLLGQSGFDTIKREFGATKPVITIAFDQQKISPVMARLAGASIMGAAARPATDDEDTSSS